MSSFHAIKSNKFLLEIQGVVKVESVLVSGCGGAYPGKLMTTNLKAATAPSRWRAIQCSRENSYRKSGFLKLRQVLRATFTNRRSWRRENPDRRGRPVLAEGEVAKRVIERVARLSRPYGTKVTARNEMGIVEFG